MGVPVCRVLHGLILHGMVLHKEQLYKYCMVLHTEKSIAHGIAYGMAGQQGSEYPSVHIAYGILYKYDIAYRSIAWYCSRG